MRRRRNPDPGLSRAELFDRVADLADRVCELENSAAVPRRIARSAIRSGAFLLRFAILGGAFYLGWAAAGATWGRLAP